MSTTNDDLQDEVQRLREEVEQLKRARKKEYDNQDDADGGTVTANRGVDRRKFLKALGGGAAGLSALGLMGAASGYDITSSHPFTLYNATDQQNFEVDTQGVLTTNQIGRSGNPISNIYTDTINAERVSTETNEGTEVHTFQGVDGDTEGIWSAGYHTLVTESDASADASGSGYLVLDEGVSLAKRYDDGSKGMHEMLKNYGPNVFLEAEAAGGRVGLDANTDQTIVLQRREASSGNKVPSVRLEADGSDLGNSHLDVREPLRVIDQDIRLGVGGVDPNRVEMRWNEDQSFFTIRINGNPQLTIFDGDNVRFYEDGDFQDNDLANVAAVRHGLSGQPDPWLLDENERATYVSDGTDGHNEGDLVSVRKDSEGNLIDQVIAAAADDS